MWSSGQLHTGPGGPLEAAQGRGWGGTGAWGTVPCRYGSTCTRANCRFRHPNNAVASAQPAPPALPTQPRPLATMEVGLEIVEQLRHGMIYHLNRFLGRRGLQGRLHNRRHQLELLSLGESEAAADVHIIEQELLRLASLRQQLTERIPVAQDLVARLIGPQGQICRMLSRDLGVQVRVQNSLARVEEGAVVEMTGDPAVIDEARTAMEEHLISFLQHPPLQARAEQQLRAEREEVAHVFVDNSNISIGCQLLPSGTRDFAQRIDIYRFAQVVAGVRQVHRQVVVGSRPPAGHGIWRHWEQAGFQVLVEFRDPETNREQFVDARLVAEALMHVEHVDREGQSGRHVLVLCTGDGNVEGQAAGTAGANFINLAEAVARRGWRVEVWCWRSTCNSAYRRLAADHAGVHVCYLDGLRDIVTRTLRPAPEETLCLQCLSNVPTHAFLPCNHRVLCTDCAVRLAPHQGRPPLGHCITCQVPWTALVATPGGSRF
mmetsp:Transcript_715/g.1294  ORF Transcript_715/g.1294 Transcript_715/m.1294 type:complete len:489 (-) Transcript_715:142-1608(-)